MASSITEHTYTITSEGDHVTWKLSVWVAHPRSKSSAVRGEILKDVINTLLGSDEDIQPELPW